jgi:hypothetical protein
MGDRNGSALSPGDPVGWYGGDSRADMVPATVVREVGPNRYLIRIELHTARGVSKIDVAELVEQNMVDHGFEADDASKAAAGFREVDTQEPFEVKGVELELRQGD